MSRLLQPIMTVLYVVQKHPSRLALSTIPTLSADEQILPRFHTSDRRLNCTIGPCLNPTKASYVWNWSTF